MSPPRARTTQLACSRLPEAAAVALEADHESAVNSAAFSYDGTLLATAGQDHAVRVTEWQSGDALAVLPHDLEVDAAVFTTDPDQLVTSTRREAVLWQWRTGQRRATFAPPAEERAANPVTAIIGVDISRDNSTVVTAHYQYARTWDVSTGTQLAALWHAGIVYTAVFNHAGDQVVTASGADGHVRVWDARAGDLLRTLPGPSRQLRCAALSPDGRWAAGADAGGTVTLWGVINEQVAAVFRQHAETIMSIVFSPDSALLLTASDDWTAKAVAIGSLNPVKVLVQAQLAGLAAPRPVMPGGSGCRQDRTIRSGRPRMPPTNEHQSDTRARPARRSTVRARRKKPSQMKG